MQEEKWEDVRELASGHAMDGGVAGDALDAVERVEVFVQGDLEDGGGTLAGGDNRVGEEEDPDAVPPV